MINQNKNDNSSGGINGYCGGSQSSSRNNT